MCSKEWKYVGFGFTNDAEIFAIHSSDDAAKTLFNLTSFENTVLQNSLEQLLRLGRRKPVFVLYDRTGKGNNFDLIRDSNL